MEYDKIKQLIDDMGSSKLTAIDIEFPDGMKISMKKDVNKEDVFFNGTASNDINSDEQANITESISNSESKKVVKSPMVGTFYAKPSPTAEAYVQLGQEIKKGDTLCIIEAMKLMNEIESEYNGKIKDILVNDGQVIEYGTPLFIIE